MLVNQWTISADYKKIQQKAVMVFYSKKDVFILVNEDLWTELREIHSFVVNSFYFQSNITTFLATKKEFFLPLVAVLLQDCHILQFIESIFFYLKMMVKIRREQKKGLVLLYFQTDTKLLRKWFSQCSFKAHFLLLLHLEAERSLDSICRSCKLCS